MKKYPFIVLLLVFCACGNHVDSADIAKINGYWEIEKVILPGGSKKEYKISETIDEFRLKADTGFRKKVKPQFDGSYAPAGAVEKIGLISENGKYFLKYTTDYSKWKEEIVEAADSTLVLKSESDLEYHYKRHVPFNIK